MVNITVVRVILSTMEIVSSRVYTSVQSQIRKKHFDAIAERNHSPIKSNKTSFVSRKFKAAQHELYVRWDFCTSDILRESYPHTRNNNKDVHRAEKSLRTVKMKD